MDPLSVSASIVTLIQVSSTIVGYLSDVRDAPSQLQQLRQEVSSTLPILTALHDQVNSDLQGESSPASLRALTVPDGTFDQLLAALNRVASKLAAIQGWRKLGKAFTWPFGKKEIAELLSTIERQKIILSLARQDDHIALSKAIEGQALDIRGKVEELHTKLSASEKYEKVRKWLSPPDPSSNHNKAVKLHHGNTGDWFLQSDAYKTWLSESGHLLWLHGIPGCGKTILSSTIVEELRRRCSPRSDPALLYFYFDFNDSGKQQNEKLISSLIFQICSHHGDVPSVLDSLYTSHDHGERRPSYDSLALAFRKMLGGCRETYLVIDALDECSDREETLSSVAEFLDWEETNLHLLVTSRKERDIEESLQPLCQDHCSISIQGNPVDEDILAYIRDKVKTHHGLQRWRKMPNVQKEIEQSLMENANGMFRWVECQLSSLKTCFSLQAFRKALNALPKTLDDTYARILCGIEEEYRQDALHILQWLSHAFRPLDLQEVAEIITIDPNNNPRVDQEKTWPDPQDILRICPNLISLELETKEYSDDESEHTDDVSDSIGKANSIDRESLDLTQEGKPMVKLAHFSVKEYLISERIRQGEAKDFSIEEISAHQSIYNDCLAYLLQFDHMRTLPNSFEEDYPLALYARRMWTEHARIAQLNGKDESSLDMELLLSHNCAFLNWIRIGDPEGLKYAKVINEPGPEDLHPPLYYASHEGLSKSVRILLEIGADVNTSSGGIHGSALQAASSNGHTAVVQILLEGGVNASASKGFYGNALSAASYNGHVTTVQTLLQGGADVNAQGGAFGNALQVASREGYVRVVQMLLAEGANVNAHGGFYQTALQAAATEGHLEIVRILLAEGADVNAQGGRHRSALGAAIARKHRDLEQILRENGAEEVADEDTEDEDTEDEDTKDWDNDSQDIEN